MVGGGTSNSIVITGCSTGIGRHCALDLHKRGWRVIATARRDDDMRELVRDGLETVLLDYAQPATIAAAAEEISHLLDGRLFALFNNGAYGQPGAVEDLPVEALRQQFEANVLGWHDLTRRLLPLMRANGAGRIVQNSSILGFVPLRGRGAYVASKFALEGLTDTLRLELKGTGIHVVSIAPGPITSKFRENALKHFQKHIDVERSANREEYERQLKRLETAGSAPFELGPEAVCAKLRHALTSANPKPNYYVTVPTHALLLLKRILPRRAFNAFMGAVGD